MHTTKTIWNSTYTPISTACEPDIRWRRFLGGERHKCLHKYRTIDCSCKVLRSLIVPAASFVFHGVFFFHLMASVSIYVRTYTLVQSTETDTRTSFGKWHHQITLFSSFVSSFISRFVFFFVDLVNPAIFRY